MSKGSPVPRAGQHACHGQVWLMEVHAWAVSGALAARGEVERLAHGQQWDVHVALLHAPGRPVHRKLLRAPPVVRHAPRYLWVLCSLQLTLILSMNLLSKE